MGDRHNDTVRVDFDRTIKLEFHGSTVTSDAGLLAYRELDEALGLTSAAASGLHDTRTGQNTQHSLLALLRQSIYSRLAGYEDVNDAQRLCLDPALRAVVGGRAKEHTAASTSEMARFETKTLRTTENLKHLMDRSGQWIDLAHQHRKLTKLILDMDSSVSETYGHQEGSAYNGHFVCTCYHPLFLFNQFGDLERVLLRRGNRASAKYWRRVLLPVIDRYRNRSCGWVTSLPGVAVEAREGAHLGKIGRGTSAPGRGRLWARRPGGGRSCRRCGRGWSAAGPCRSSGRWRRR
jgi:hypothetical protein